jgi:hypothetical protein
MVGGVTLGSLPGSKHDGAGPPARHDPAGPGRVHDDHLGHSAKHAGHHRSWLDDHAGAGERDHGTTEDTHESKAEEAAPATHDGATGTDEPRATAPAPALHDAGGHDSSGSHDSEGG